MTQEIEQLVTQIKQATDFQINKKILHEKNQTDLHFAYNGGLFKASPELISFVHAWRATNEIWEWDGGENMYMEDTYGNPIHIDNCAEFYKTACRHYQRVMNEWHQAHTELKKVRRV